MTNAEADALIETLPKPRGLHLHREGDEIIMDGGRWGGHSIRASVSSGERLLVHWKGYIENNGQAIGTGYAPEKPLSTTATRDVAVGEWVSFPSKSSRTGWRKGQVLKVTKTRALIAFQFKYERERGYFKAGEIAKLDPITANKTWRKLSEIKRR